MQVYSNATTVSGHSYSWFRCAFAFLGGARPLFFKNRKFPRVTHSGGGQVLLCMCVCRWLRRCQQGHGSPDAYSSRARRTGAAMSVNAWKHGPHSRLTAWVAFAPCSKPSYLMMLDKQMHQTMLQTCAAPMCAAHHTSRVQMQAAVPG